MKVIEITSVNQPGPDIYASLSEAELRMARDEREGIFIAESPKVIKVALDSGYEPISLLCEKKHICGDAAAIIQRLGDDVPIYTGNRDVLASLTGYTLTRGVLCAMKRKESLKPEHILKNARRIAVIDGVCDTTNIGSIFRAAAALGIDGVLLTPTSCDPLNRRSIRVSMGTVFQIKWCFSHSVMQDLKNNGFKTLAMALKPYSIPLDSPEIEKEEKLAVILGTEGDGLDDTIIDASDYAVIIPMHNNVDSLNVASAAAVTFWQLRTKDI